MELLQYVVVRPGPTTGPSSLLFGPLGAPERWLKHIEFKTPISIGVPENLPRTVEVPLSVHRVGKLGAGFQPVERWRLSGRPGLR